MRQRRWYATLGVSLTVTTLWTLFIAWPYMKWVVVASGIGRAASFAATVATVGPMFSALLVYSLHGTSMTNHRLSVRDWPLLSMTGSGPRLVRGLLGPAAMSGLLTLLFHLPVVIWFQTAAGVPLWVIACQFMLSVGSWCLLASVATWIRTISMRSPLWAAGCAVFLFALFWLGSGRFAWWLSSLWAMRPGFDAPASSWTVVLLSGLGLAVVGAGIAACLGPAFLTIAGDEFGKRPGTVKLSEIQLPKLFRQRTTRRSRKWRSSSPVFERELREWWLGITGLVWLALVLLAALMVVTLHVPELMAAMQLRLVQVKFLAWAVPWLSWMVAILVSLFGPLRRLDAEARQRTATPLFLALSARAFVWQLMLAVGTTAFWFLFTGVAVAFGLAALDERNTPMAMTFLVAASVTAVSCCYLIVLSSTVRMTYRFVLAQGALYVAGLIFCPIMIFILPALWLRGVDRLNGDPDVLEMGLSRTIRKQLDTQ